MITFAVARQLAIEKLKALQLRIRGSILTIGEASTREEAFGWIFFWNDKRYIETGNMIYALAGNSPIVVLRDTGEATSLRWQWDLETSISDFAAELSRYRSGRDAGRPDSDH